MQHNGDRDIGTGRFEDLSWHVRNGTVDRRVIQDVCWNDEYRVKWAAQTMSEIRTILDLGGHIGVFAVWVAKHFTKSEVYSVEMEADNFSLLEANTRQHGRVHPFRAAVVGGRVPVGQSQLSTRGTWGHFLVYGDRTPGGGKIFNSDTRVQVDADLVTATDCFDLCQASVDFLKVDIEGSEYDVVLNLGGRLREVLYMAMEVHPWAMPLGTVDLLLDCVHQHFLQVEVLDRKPSDPRNQFMVYAHGRL